MSATDLKVLMISTDRNILSSGSAVSTRMKEYGSLVKELYIVLLCDKKHDLKESKLSENVWVYPTSSQNKFLRPFDAFKIGKNIVAGKSLITTQDPFECGWVGMKLKKKFGVPLEVQLHTDPDSQYFAGFLNWLRKQIMKRVMRHADTVRDVVNLPIYVDRGKINKEIKFDLHQKYGFKHVFLMVTRLTKEKNIGLALKAFAKVREQLPDSGLVIVGSGPEKFKEQEGVVFAGWQEDLSSYYRTADIFLQTSDYEGYGLSLVEAGLSDLPVISTPVGVATKLKNVTLASSIEEFVQAIENTLNNPKNGLKQELESRVLDKDTYLTKIKENWIKTAQSRT